MNPRRRHEQKPPRRAARASSAARPLSPAFAPPKPAPPPWRDGWAWASVLAVLPAVLHALGAPLGEPVAEDFDFLHHALFEPRHSLLDGGGSLAFWRPLSHQVYYGLLGPLILSNPRLVAALHAALLALGSLLLYRTLRRSWPGYAAAAAAAFPLLAESIRTVITWPSHFVDVGPYLFSALALHEAAHRRMASSLGALLAALLCKEVAVVTALLLPWMPDTGRAERKTRLRWAVATGALVAVWAVLYLAVRRSAGLALPHHLESDPALLATPLPVRLAWAFGNSVRAIFSLPPRPGPWDQAVLLAGALIVAAALVVIATRAAARARLARRGPWPWWGLAWFALASAMLAVIFPLWAPARSLFASIGLGVGLAALLGAAHPLLLGALVALRLLTFALSPGPPPAVSPTTAETQTFIDFERIVRLQRLMLDTRTVLERRFPTLPPHARIGMYYVPRHAEYAFGGARAFQVWYRDSTLRRVSYTEFSAHPERPVVTLLEYEPARKPQIALVEPDAMRNVLGALAEHRKGNDVAALARLDRADSIQRDPNAEIFAGQVAGVRAMALAFLEQFDDAEREARRGLALWHENTYAEYTLGLLAYRVGSLDEAMAHCNRVLGLDRQDRRAASLRAAILRARAARAGAPVPGP